MFLAPGWDIQSRLWFKSETNLWLGAMFGCKTSTWISERRFSAVRCSCITDHCRHVYMTPDYIKFHLIQHLGTQMPLMLWLEVVEVSYCEDRQLIHVATGVGGC